MRGVILRKAATYLSLRSEDGRVLFASMADCRDWHALRPGLGIEFDLKLDRDRRVAGEGSMPGLDAVNVRMVRL